MLSTSAPPISAQARAPWTYRADIDVLRGIAVLAVLIYHLNETWLPGGFAGVDVFFVISGYVVSGSLLSHRQEPLGQQLLGFYQRRIRRLVPNLLVNVVLTCLAVALLVPPEESRSLFTTGVKALYGWSNNHFALAATDYFGLDAHLNPLSHTWSLGVEEQFYLLVPVLLLLLGRWQQGRWLLPGLLSAVVASLALSFHWTQQAPVLAFFLMPSRFWELSIGVLLLLAQRRGWLASPGQGSGASWCRWGGVAVLAAALLFSNPNQGFPVPGAFPAVLATLALLQGGGHWGPLQQPLLRCGLLSYSLYLWHWPVLTLMRWTVGLDQPLLLALALGLSFGLALPRITWWSSPCAGAPSRRRGCLASVQRQLR